MHILRGVDACTGGSRCMYWGDTPPCCHGHLEGVCRCTVCPMYSSCCHGQPKGVHIHIHMCTKYFSVLSRTVGRRRCAEHVLCTPLAVTEKLVGIHALDFETINKPQPGEVGVINLERLACAYSWNWNSLCRALLPEITVIHVWKKDGSLILRCQLQQSFHFFKETVRLPYQIKPDHWRPAKRFYKKKNKHKKNHRTVSVRFINIDSWSWLRTNW